MLLAAAAALAQTDQANTIPGGSGGGAAAGATNGPGTGIYGAPAPKTRAQPDAGAGDRTSFMGAGETLGTGPQVGTGGNVGAGPQIKAGPQVSTGPSVTTGPQVGPPDRSEPAPDAGMQ